MTFLCAHRSCVWLESGLYWLDVCLLTVVQLESGNTTVFAEHPLEFRASFLIDPVFFVLSGFCLKEPILLSRIVRAMVEPTVVVVKVSAINITVGVLHSAEHAADAIRPDVDLVTDQCGNAYRALEEIVGGPHDCIAVKSKGFEQWLAEKRLIDSLGSEEPA